MRLNDGGKNEINGIGDLQSPQEEYCCQGEFLSNGKAETPDRGHG